METKFLRGRFIKIWMNTCQVMDNTRDTLIAVDDIKRIKACTVYIHDHSTKKLLGTRAGLVISATGRLKDSEDSVDCYELIDPVSVIGEAIGRDPDELSSLLLELELKD